MTTAIGIDIAKDKFDVAVQVDNAQPQMAAFENNPKGFKACHVFLKRANAYPGHVCMEATGVYYEELAHFLHQAGYPVSVINPLQISGYAHSRLRRNKTDRLDAALLVDFVRTQSPPLWTPPEPSWYELRSLVRHLEDLESDRQRQRNRRDAIRHSAQPSAIVLTNLDAQIAFLTDQIKQIKGAIQHHIDQHPALKQSHELLDSIKGIGTLTASKLLAECGDMSQFDDVRQLVAFAGLNPQHHLSGSSVRGKTHISKIGNASIRAALYMPAVNAKRFNTLLQPFIARLEQRGLCDMEIVTAIMRKLLHLAYGILKSGRPFDPDFLQSRLSTP
jgi:transposase